MSEFEDQYASAWASIFSLYALAAVLPWGLLIAAAWLLEPRTGSWGLWPHLIGGGWCAILVLLVVWVLARSHFSK